MQSSTPPAAVVILAHNEEGFVGNTIKLVQKTGLARNIIVIDDGSRDNTVREAVAAGAHVRRYSLNRGKSSAFFAGLREAAKTKPSAVVVLDADLIKLPSDALSKLIYYADARTTLNESFMVTASFREGWLPFETHISLSGLRSFSMPAVYRLLSSKQKSLINGYGLEYFLEHFFAESQKHAIFHTGILARAMYRGDEMNSQRQFVQIVKTRQRLRKWRSRRRS